MKFASSINSKGIASLQAQLADFGKDFDAYAVAEEIELTNTFSETEEGNGCSIEAGFKLWNGYNAFYYLGADMIDFEETEEMLEPVFKLHNINGRFDHVRGKEAAIAKANEIEKETDLTEDELVREWGWTFTELSETDAEAVGL